MGQRLVITFEKDEEPIIGVYYHWGAYTCNALSKLSNLMEAIYSNNKTSFDIRLEVLRYIEHNGGCIKDGEYGEEFKYISSLYPDEKFATDGNRSDGLVAFSQDGIRHLTNWAEGIINIDLNNDLIYFNVLNIFSNPLDVEEYYDGCDYKYNIINTDVEDYSVFGYEDIDDFLSIWNTIAYLKNNTINVLKDKYGNCYTAIA